MAFNIRGKLSLDGAGFSAGVQKAKAKANSLKTAIGSAFSKLGPMMGAAAGAMAVAMITQQVKKTIEWGARIRDLGMQFGVSTRFVQQMSYAFRQTGMDVNVAFKSFRKMQLAISQARGGIEGMTQTTADMKLGAFKILGITLKDIKSLAPEDLFRKIAQQVNGMNFASADLHQAMNDIFGKAGSELLVAFGNDFEAMAAKVEAFMVDDSGIQKLGRIGDKMEDFKDQNRGIWADIVGGMHDLFMQFVDVATVSIEMLAENLVAIWNGLAKAISGVGQLISGLADMDMSKIKAAGDEIASGVGDALQNVAETGAGIVITPFVVAADTVGLGELGEMGKRLAARQKERDEKLKQRELDKKGALDAQSVADAKKEQEEAEAAIGKLKEDALKRETDSMSIAQKLLHFNLMLLAAREKLSALPAFHSKEEIAAAQKGLNAVQAADRASELTAENLERMEAEKEVAGLVASQSKAQAAQAKAAPKKDLAGWAGDAKFAQLARIGGALGGRNPVLDIAKKQYYTIQELRDIAARQATSLSQISGTP